MSLSEKTMSLNVELTGHCFVKTSTSNLPPIVLLHGFQDRPVLLHDRLFGELRVDRAIYVPQGPFPVPHAKEGGFREAYAWYFVDPTANRVFIPPDTAIRSLEQMFTNLDLRTPSVVIGFSQGGYLAPLLSKILPISNLILLGAGGRSEFYDSVDPKTEIHFVHGEKDDVVVPERSAQIQETLSQRGFLVSRTVLPNQTHRMTTAFGRQILKILSEES